MKLSELILELMTELAENGDRELSENFLIFISDYTFNITY